VNVPIAFIRRDLICPCYDSISRLVVAPLDYKSSFEGIACQHSVSSLLKVVLHVVWLSEGLESFRDHF